MRIDSHQHFWNYDSSAHGWITEQMDVLRRDFLPGELRPLLANLGFDGSIAIQARQCVAETDWLLKLADGHAFIRGVVGWVDLLAPDIRGQLKHYTANPKFVGVRHVVHDEVDDDFMLRPEFRRGIAQLAEFDLTYDLLLFPKHLPVAMKLVEEFPAQRFVLDHIAKPRIGDRLFSPWQEHLAALAEYPNVWCKLSGMVTETHWKQWQPVEFHHYLDVVLAAFGGDRLMIGSDWPVCTLSGEYAAVMRIVIDYTQKLPARVRDGIMGDNCMNFYHCNLKRSNERIEEPL